MTKLNLALVHAYAWPEVRRGGERLVDDLKSYLRSAGHHVDVFCGTKGESRFHPGPQGRDYRLRIPWLRALEGYGLTRLEMFGARALVPMLLHRYDAVHAFTPTGALAAVAAGQPTVYTVIGHPTTATLPDSPIQRRTLAQAVASSSEVAALSRSAATSLEEALGRSPIVLPPGVQMSRFEPELRPRSGPPRFLFSGDLGNPDKGLGVLLSAFERVLVRHPDARLALSGPGRTDRVRREVGAVWDRIEGSIDVLGTGAVEDVPERYRGAHVTVLPSRDEAFGIVLVESLACGTPVIGGERGGAEDIVTSPETGKLVGFRDVEALAGAMDEGAELARDPCTPERCRAHAESWDWTVVGPKYEAVYRSIAGRRRPPGTALWRSGAIRPGARAERSGVRPSPS